MSAPRPSEADVEAERPLTLAEQLCQHVHPSIFAEQVFGSCDPCKRYTLAVIESDWLADDRATREAAAATKARADERERIAQAVDLLPNADHVVGYQEACDDAARIARGDA